MEHHAYRAQDLVFQLFPEQWRLFVRSGQNHLARHSERGKKTRQTEEEVGRHHQGMDRPGVCQVPEGSGEKRKMEETGCEVICGAQTTYSIKEYVKVIYLSLTKVHLHEERSSTIYH